MFLDKQFIESIIENIPNAVFYKDRDLVYRYCNTGFAAYIGRTKEEIIGATVYEISPKELADVYHKADLEILEHKENQVYESFVQSADGSMRRVIFSKSVLMDDDGQVQGVIGVIQDVTDKYNTEKMLDMLYKVKDAFLNINRDILNYASTKQFFNGIQRRLSHVFDGSERATVLKIDEAGVMSILVNFGYLQSSADDFYMNFEDSYVNKVAQGDFNKALIIDDAQTLVEEGFRKHALTDNGNLPRSVLSIPIFSEGSLKYILSYDSGEPGVFTETDRIIGDYIVEELPIVLRVFQLYRKNLQLSRYDGLTDLFNRRTFDKLLSSHLDHIDNTNEKICLVIIDLDNLKHINDTFGHLGGDAYILALRDLLRAELDSSVRIGRIGGDEFALMFSNVPRVEVDEIMADLKTKFSEKEIPIDESSFKGSFSCGVSESDVDGIKKSSLFRAADQRMYKDKEDR